MTSLCFNFAYEEQCVFLQGLMFYIQVLRFSSTTAFVLFLFTWLAQIVRLVCRVREPSEAVEMKFVTGHVPVLLYNHQCQCQSVEVVKFISEILLIYRMETSNTGSPGTMYTSFVSTGCTDGSHASWKVMEFKRGIFQAWKVMENDCGHGKAWNSIIRSWNFLYRRIIILGVLTIKLKEYKITISD